MMDMFHKCPCCGHELTWTIKPYIVGKEAKAKCSCGYLATRFFREKTDLVIDKINKP